MPAALILQAALATAIQTAINADSTLTVVESQLLLLMPMKQLITSGSIGTIFNGYKPIGSNLDGFKAVGTTDAIYQPRNQEQHRLFYIKR